MAARVRERQKGASTPLYRAALIAGNSDVKAGAALSAAHWPAPSRIAPVAAETVNQHIHVKRAKAVAMGAPCTDAAMAVDKIAEGLDFGAGHPSRMECEGRATSPAVPWIRISSAQAEPGPSSQLSHSNCTFVFAHGLMIASAFMGISLELWTRKQRGNGQGQEGRQDATRLP
jgi:hypothetical protein